MPGFTRSELMALLRRAGFKVTPQRLAICEFILSRDDHPNAETVFAEMQQRYPAISRATIYNTLHVLEEASLIEKLGFDDGTSRYEPDRSFHVNLVCKRCGKILDIKHEQLEKAWLDMVASTGVQPVGQRLDLYHECLDCARKHRA